MSHSCVPSVASVAKRRARGQLHGHYMFKEKISAKRTDVSRIFRMNRGVGDSDHFLRNKIPNIYKDNFVDLAKLCDSAKKIIH